MKTINIQVNNKTIKVNKEISLLQNLLDNGIFVPNLCHNKELESYGGCGLCLVDIEGYPKPVRACSIPPHEGMKITTDTKEIIQSRNASLSLMYADHRGDCIAPCRRACPTGQDAQGYVGLIANENFEEAIKLIKQDNPLPASIGRVCPHPCEDACRRKYAEDPISICSLKRFAADEVPDFVPERKKKTGKHIAIVGAGPAGLSCAYFLALEGHDVTIFEAMAKSGGMLRYGIPLYRLPDEIIDSEVALIEKLGVNIIYNKTLGKDFLLADLQKDYDAVFVGIGAWKSGPLRCENDDLPGVYGGIDFLRDVAEGKRPNIGDRVAIVGGGNTAIDAARTAKRLGAKEVVLVYRRSRNEMPAAEWEIEEAEEEGICFLFLSMPDSVFEEDGRAAGLVIQKCELGEPDESGRCRAIPIACALEEERFDTIISAIGQKVVTSGLDGLDLTRWGTIIADEHSFKTNLEGVFAGGDAINNGPDIAVTAVAHGKNAAKSINAYLKGINLPKPKSFYVEKTEEVSKDIGKVEKEDRVREKCLEPSERIRHFNESTKTFTKAEAIKEASRCLECGCMALYDCRLLPLLQDHQVQKISLGPAVKNLAYDTSHPFIMRDNNKCILCGLCVRACKDLVGKEVLGFDDRGLPTTVQCAFKSPLALSECISCGYCTAVCPTGALQDVRAFSKSPPLPYKIMPAACNLCENKCSFYIYTYGKNLIKALPVDMARSCSLGRYGLTLKGNQDIKDLSQEDLEKLVSALLGDLEFFKGESPSFDTPKSVLDYFMQD